MAASDQRWTTRYVGDPPRFAQIDPRGKAPGDGCCGMFWASKFGEFFVEKHNLSLGHFQNLRIV